jgi:hypothetical protein
MNCSRNDNQAKYLRKCARLAIKQGVSEDAFVSQFLPAYQAAARAIYKQILNESGLTA